MSAVQLFSLHRIYSFTQRHDAAAKVLKTLYCKIPHQKGFFLMSVVKIVKGRFLNGFEHWVWIVQPKGNKEQSHASGDTAHSRAIKPNGCYSNLYGEV